MIHHNQCPVCKHHGIKALFAAKDHTVSGKSFSIWSCQACKALFTQDVPDQHEIGTFYRSESYISHTDTRKGLINALYHSVRSFTLKIKQRVVNRETGLSSGQLLDVGCGTGAFLDHMRGKGWEVTGVEPDNDARNKAKELYGINCLPAESFFALEPGRYQAITLWHVLEHVHELHRYIDQLKTLLSNNGKIFIAVPNHTSTDASNYQSYWAAYDVPRHLYHFSPDCMRTLMVDHGMRVREVIPMWFDSFYVSMLSEGCKQSKPAFLRPLKGFYQGLLSNVIALSKKEKCSSLIYVIEKMP